MQSGKAVFRLAPAGPRKPAFVLAPTGFAPVAFLWRGLLVAGPVFRPRYALLALVLALAGTQWLAHSPTWHPLLRFVAILAAMLSGWLLVIGPMLVQRGLRETLEQLDIFKAGPLRGWQIALGQLLTPVALISVAQWLFLLVAARGFAAGDVSLVGGPANLWAGALAAALVAPALCALMLCLPFAGLLFFPAWTTATGGRGGGFEVIGQRMLFMGGYLVALVAALFPVAVIAGGGFALAWWLGAPLAAIVLAALLALAVLGVELALAVLWLGRRIDRFDVSQELR
jgi:hypothetical protein